jgi:RND superfamily putative drug exporter
VITSAGILLAAVFLVLGVLPLVVLAQLGVIVCIGVLLDTLVVRTVLVPALAVRLGERFWWPRRVGPVSPVSPVSPE